jgi:hypothetical protein
MAKSYYVNANVNPYYDTWAGFLAKLNTIVTDMGTTVLTVNTSGSTPDTVTGNAYVNGYFGANTLYVNRSLTGGNSSVSSNLTISTNTFVSNSILNVGNTTVNVAINSTSFSGTANSATYLGNTSLSTIQTWITGNTGTAYTNATSYSANANNISSGTVAAARLGSGTANSSTILYGNNYWGPAPTSGGSNVNTAGQYTWTNTQTFSANVSVGGILSVSNTATVSGNLTVTSGQFIGNGAGLTSVFASNTSYLLGYNWTAPAAIGSGIANTGSFTTVTLSNQLNTNTSSSELALNYGSPNANLTVYANTGSGAVAIAKVGNFGLSVLSGNLTASNATFTNLGTSVTSGGSTFTNYLGYNPGRQSLFEATGSLNNYIDAVIWNANSGTNASSDLAVYNDLGPSSTTFIDMGISSSGWANGQWTIGGPSDGYLYTGNTNLTIGVAAYGGGPNYINFFTGGTLTANERFRITANGYMLVANTAALQFVSGSKLIDSTGSQGTAGQILTSNGSGNVYWAPAASAGVNTSAQYTFSNTITFNANLNANAIYTNSLNTTGNLSVSGVISGNGSGITGITSTPTANYLRHQSSGAGYVSGIVSVTTTAPLSPTKGDIWFDISGNTGYTQSLSSSGYTKLPNGLIFQWGSAYMAIDSSTTISWPIAFNTCYGAVTGVADNTISSGTNIPALGIFPTTSGASIYNDGNNRTVYWMAYGV